MLHQPTADSNGSPTKQATTKQLVTQPPSSNGDDYDGVDDDYGNDGDDSATKQATTKQPVTQPPSNDGDDDDYSNTYNGQDDYGYSDGDDVSTVKPDSLDDDDDAWRAVQDGKLDGVQTIWQRVCRFTGIFVVWCAEYLTSCGVLATTKNHKQFYLTLTLCVCCLSAPMPPCPPFPLSLFHSSVLSVCWGSCFQR